MNITTGKIKSPQKIVIYGPEGVGKTKLATLFPNPIFIDTEGSTKHYDVSRLDAPTSYSMFQEQINWLINQQHNFNTLIIDTIDWLEELVSQHVCAVGGEHGPVKGIEDFGFGKGYNYLKEEFSRMLNALSHLSTSRNMNIVLLAHTHLKSVNLPEESGQFDKYELKLSKKNAPLPKEWADAVFFVNYKTFVKTDSTNKTKATGGRRTLYTSHSPSYEAKCRFEGVPKEIDYQDAPENVWNVISPFIPAGDIAPKPVQSAVQPTTTQQSVASTALSPSEVTNPSQSLTTTEKTPDPNNMLEGLEDQPVNMSFCPQLWDLMEQSGITAEELENFAVSSGHLSQGTKLDDFPIDYCDMLVTNWQQVKRTLNK